MALPASSLAGQATAPAPKLTGRGAVLGMAVLFTLGLLMASWLGATALAGIFFVLGCALAAWFTRPTDLLIVVLTPPILFSGALLFVEVVTASGSLLLSVVAGGVVMLTSIALWLAAGLVVTVAIAWPRGLPQSVKDLYRDLRSSPARRGPRGNSARRRPPGSATAARAAPAATRVAARTASAPEPPQRPQPR